MIKQDKNENCCANLFLKDFFNNKNTHSNIFELFSNLDGLIIGGMDTTANSIEYILTLLAQRTHIAQKNINLWMTYFFLFVI